MWLAVRARQLLRRCSDRENESGSSGRAASGVLQIWLQRITVKFERERQYEEKELARSGSDNGDIWDFSWLKGKQPGKSLKQIEIINEEKIEEFPPFVSKKEAELFKSDYYD